MEKGIPGQPSRVRLDALFKQLREDLAADQRPVPRSRAVNDAREFEFAYNAAPQEAQRDTDREIKDLTRRLAEAEAGRIEAEAARARDLAEAEARERALHAEMAERNRELERLHGQAHGSPPLADKQQRQLQDAIQAAELRLDEATTAHAAAAALASTASHVTAKPETVPAACPAPSSDTPPPATLSDAEIATPAPRNSAAQEPAPAPGEGSDALPSLQTLHQQIRERAATQDWDAMVATSDRLAGLDPAAADPDGLASTARQQLSHHKETGEDAPLVRVDKTQPNRGENKKTQRRRIRPARLYSGIVGAIALASLLAVSLLLATNSPKPGKGTSTSSSSSSAGSRPSASNSSPSIAALSGTLNGSGSTFQLNFQQTAISSLKPIAPNLTVNYNGSGSGSGRTDLAVGTANFAASDSPIPVAEQANFKGKTVLYFPVALGPITVSYNLSGLGKPLQLSAPVLAQIFEGKITTWNDPAILADNPGVTLPGTPITIARRSDSSGTTQYFSEFLVEAAQGEWTLGSSAVIVWPATSRSGNGDLLGAGQQLLPSLGYAPLPPNIDQMAKAQLSKIGT